jgi:hypothetical protein
VARDGALEFDAVGSEERAMAVCRGLQTQICACCCGAPNGRRGRCVHPQLANGRSPMGDAIPMSAAIPMVKNPRDLGRSRTRCRWLNRRDDERMQRFRIAKALKVARRLADSPMRRDLDEQGPRQIMLIKARHVCVSANHSTTPCGGQELLSTAKAKPRNRAQRETNALESSISDIGTTPPYGAEI